MVPVKSLSCILFLHLSSIATHVSSLPLNNNTNEITQKAAKPAISPIISMSQSTTFIPNNPSNLPSAPLTQASTEDSNTSESDITYEPIPSFEDFIRAQNHSLANFGEIDLFSDNKRPRHLQEAEYFEKIADEAKLELDELFQQGANKALMNQFGFLTDDEDDDCEDEECLHIVDASKFGYQFKSGLSSDHCNKAVLDCVAFRRCEENCFLTSALEYDRTGDPIHPCIMIMEACYGVKMETYKKYRKIDQPGDEFYF